MIQNTDLLEIEEITEEELNKEISSEIDAYSLYVKDLNKYTLLSREEEDLYFKEIESLYKKIHDDIFKNKEILNLLIESIKECKNKKINSITYFDFDEEVNNKKYISYCNQYINNLISIQDLLKKEGNTEEEMNQLLNYFNKITQEVRFENHFLLRLFDKIKQKTSSEIQDEISFKENKKALRRILKIKEDIVKRNLKLVIKIAKPYKTRHLLFIDLIQEGNLGLAKGVDRFKYQKGFKLSTYTSWWIRQAINESLSKKSRLIKLPSNVISILTQLKRKYEDFNNIPESDLEEIAERNNLTVQKIVEMIEFDKDVISLEQNVIDSANKDVNLSNVISDENNPEPIVSILEEESVSELLKWVKELPDREKEIIIRRFGLNNQEPQTLEEIGNILGLTRERIRQIETIALQKLKNDQKGRQYFL